MHDQSKVFINVNKQLYTIIYKVIVRIAHIVKNIREGKIREMKIKKL